jgi:hypothetical protein
VTTLDDLSQPYLPPASGVANDDLAKDIGQAFLASVVAAKVLDWSGLGRKWARSGFMTDHFNQEVSDKFVSVFQHDLTPLLVEAALRGIHHAQTEFGETVDVSPKVVEDWAGVYAAGVAKQIADQSTLAIQDAVNMGVNSRLPGPALADRAQQIYGLDPRSANTFQAITTNKNLPKDNNLLKVLAQLLVGRGHIIGDVHSVAGINFGKQLVYMQAMENGQLLPDARKVWLTALDERVCDTCGPMDGIAVPINQSFEVQLPLPKTSRGKNRKTTKAIVPPVHPNCRCTIVTEDRMEGGIITRTARRRGDLFSEPEDILFQKALFEESKHPRAGDGRFSRIAGHLNSHRVEGFDSHESSIRDAVTHLAGVDQEFREGMLRHAYGDFTPEEYQSAAVHMAMNDDQAGMEAMTAEGNSRVVPAFRDPEVQSRLIHHLGTDESEAAKKILGSPLYNLSNHPEVDHEDVRALVRGAEVWSNTLNGRNRIREVMATPQDRLTTYGKMLRTFVDAVEDAPHSPVRLYRGMSIDDWELANWQKGHEFSLDLSSFTDSKGVAEHYYQTGRDFKTQQVMASMSEEEALTDGLFQVGEHHNVLMILDPGAKALNISPLTLQTSQAEWVTRGRFVVQDVHLLDNAKTVIRITQVAERVFKAASVPDDDPLLEKLNTPLPKPQVEEEVAKDWTKWNQEHKHQAEEGATGAVGAAAGQGLYQSTAYGPRTVSRYVNNHNSESKSNKLWYERAMSKTPLKRMREKNKEAMSASQRDKRIKTARSALAEKLGRPPTDTEFYRAGGASHLGVTGHRLERVLSYTHGGRTGKAVGTLATIAAATAAEEALRHHEKNR